MFRIFFVIAIFSMEIAAQIAQWIITRAAAVAVRLRQKFARVETPRDDAPALRRRLHTLSTIARVRLLRDCEAHRASSAGRFARILMARGRRTVAQDMAKQAVSHFRAARAYARWVKRLREAA